MKENLEGNTDQKEKAVKPNGSKRTILYIIILVLFIAGILFYMNSFVICSGKGEQISKMPSEQGSLGNHCCLGLEAESKPNLEDTQVCQ